MALIPQEPKKRNAVLAIVVGVLVLGGVYQYVYTPKSEELQGMRDRLEALETRNRQAQLTATRGGANLEEQLALYERHVEQLEQLIPAAEEVPGLLRSVTEEGRRADVVIDFIGPEAAEPGTFYTKRAYSIRAIGTYHDIGTFMTSIASLPRIITPVDLDISLFSDPQNVYPDMVAPALAQFRIETYELPSGSREPGAAVGPQAAEGADR